MTGADLPGRDIQTGGLDDLPVHRRDDLLWRYALELDYEGLDALVRASPQSPCFVTGHAARPAKDPPLAILGSDGRYHLCRNGSPLCSERRRRKDPESVFRHSQWCFWWHDGETYRVQAPPRAYSDDFTLVVGARSSRTKEWQVTLTNTGADPMLVPLRRRCPQSRDWPGYRGVDTRDGRQRALLIAELGPDCHACGRGAGAVVDHDHYTGLVRGLVCRICNGLVDHCLHVAGCRWADYLNNPPAAPLQLRYTRHTGHKNTQNTRWKIEILGFDPRIGGQLISAT